MLRQSQKFSFWKSCELQLAGCAWTLDGHLLSLEDSERVANVLVLNAMLLHDTFECTEYNRSASDAALASWLERLGKQDLRSFLDQGKLALQILREGHRPWRAFKQRCRELKLDPDILGPVYLTLVRFVKTGLPSDFREANSCIQFPMRLTLRDVDWIENDNITSFLKFEDDLANLSYPKWIIDRLRNIITDWFRDINLDDLRPNHGNGATGDVKRGSGVCEKYQKLQRTAAADWFEKAYGPTLPSCCNFDEKPMRSALSQIGVVQLVPKGFDKKRVISMEATTHQYYQKAVADCIRRFVSAHKDMHICFENQQYNRDLALEGSEKGNYGTVDISSASDSVTLLLVEEIFRDTPLRPFLSMFRTPFVIISGNILFTRKYLPMGSDLCFPIESIVFSAISKLAVQTSGCRHKYYRVYGDDIVIPRRAEKMLLYFLELLHFDVNQSKSFLGEPGFRESCGIEAYLGIDVSPIRISRRWNVVLLNHAEKRKHDPSALPASIDLCNRLLAFGYPTARRYMLHRLLEVYPQIPFGYPEGTLDTADNSYLHSWNPTNGHLTSRFVTSRKFGLAYQRLEYLALQLYTRASKGDDALSYELTLKALQESKRTSLLLPEDRIEIRTGATHVQLRRMWVPQSKS